MHNHSWIVLRDYIEGDELVTILRCEICGLYDEMRQYLPINSDEIPDMLKKNE